SNWKPCSKVGRSPNSMLIVSSLLQDRASAVASRVAQVVWLLSKPRDDIGRESAGLRVAPLNQSRQIRFGLSGRQHAHHDLSPRLPKHLALTAQAMQRR